MQRSAKDDFLKNRHAICSLNPAPAPQVDIKPETQKLRWPAFSDFEAVHSIGLLAGRFLVFALFTARLLAEFQQTIAN
jgi:hypothetical protein